MITITRNLAQRLRAVFRRAGIGRSRVQIRPFIRLASPEQERPD